MVSTGRKLAPSSCQKKSAIGVGHVCECDPCAHEREVGRKTDLPTSLQSGRLIEGKVQRTLDGKITSWLARGKVLRLIPIDREPATIFFLKKGKKRERERGESSGVATWWWWPKISARIPPFSLSFWVFPPFAPFHHQPSFQRDGQI